MEMPDGSLVVILVDDFHEEMVTGVLILLTLVQTKFIREKRINCCTIRNSIRRKDKERFLTY
jgi:hypothetical protein